MLSEFFRDLDVVPSDVIVGLVLLRKRQQLLRIRTIHQVNLKFRLISRIPCCNCFGRYLSKTTQISVMPLAIFVSAGETLYVGRGLVDGKFCLGDNGRVT